MKKLKCSSCGAELQIEDNKEYAICNHCKSRYKLNEDLNINIKLDDNAKEVLDNRFKAFNHMSKFMLIPIIIFVIVFISIVYFGFIRAGKEKEEIDDRSNKYEELTNQIINTVEEQMENTLKETFNSKFSTYSGEKTANFVESILNGIIQSNKIYDRKVVLVFNGLEVTSESEIKNIKKSLNGNYEVSLDYDEDRYVNKVIVNSK